MDVQEETQQVDPKVHEAVAAILSKDLSDLTLADRAFLRARQSYLGRNARKKFADVLDAANDPQPEVVGEQEQSDLTHPAEAQTNDSQQSDEDDVE